jgi:WD40 repeat protein/serine/threonine protein kinase
MSASESKSTLVQELAEEFLERYRQGQRPSLKEYIDRHPHLAADIREVFPAMALMENIALDNESLTGEDPARQEPQPPEPLQQLGDYRIIRKVGQGGMGIVYEAEQVSLGRHVALKVLPQKLLLDANQKRRFEREARAAAKLHHTNIVPVFGVGEHEGLPYYVMQFIQGLGLDVVLDELRRVQPGARPSGEVRAAPRDVTAADVARSLLTGAFEGTQDLPAAPRTAASGEDAIPPPPVAAASPTRPAAGQPSDAFTLSSSSVTLPGQNLSAHRPNARKPSYWQSVAQIGVQVADALDYAHRQGIQHRDIKPSNLLLDTRGTVWVADFGLAKADDQQNLTHTGDLLGTLRYMPPEAFEGKTDLRSDIYSLGLTLFELLAFRPAFDSKERNPLIKQVSGGDAPRLDKLNRAVPRDLVTIVHKAIECEPARRYPTAAELEADLQRFLDDEPIRARRTSAWERLVRWSRHNRGLAASLAVIAGLLLAGLLGLGIATARFHEQAVAQGQLAKEKEEERAQAVGARHKLALTLTDMHTFQGLMAGERGDPAQAVLWFANAVRLAEGDPQRQHVNRIRASTWSRQTFTPVHGFSKSGGGDHILGFAFHPDGRYLLASEVVSWQGEIDQRQCTVWDLEREQPVPGPAGAASSAAWSPDGKWLALSGPEGGVTLSRFPGGDAVQRIASPGRVRYLTFSPDGHFLAVIGDTTVRVWDCRAQAFATGELRHPALVDTLCFSPRSDSLVTGCRDGRARVFAIARDATRPRFPPLPHARWTYMVYGSQPIPPAYLEDGRQLLTCAGNDLTWWNAATGTKVRSARVLEGMSIGSVTPSPDGKVVVVAGAVATEGRAQLYELASGRAVSPLFRHRNSSQTTAFSPDSKMLLTGSTDRTVRLWAVPSGAPLAPPLVHPASVHVVAFAPDGRSLVTGQEGGQVRVWGLPQGNPRGYRVPLDGQNSFARLSPDGKHLLASGMSHGDCTLLSTRVYDVAGGKPAGPALRPGGVIVDAAFAPDGRHVATVSGRSGVVLGMRMPMAPRVHIWDWKTGERAFAPVVLPSDPRCLDYSPDGRRLAVFCAGGQLVIVDATRGQRAAQWPIPPVFGVPSHYIHGNGAVRFGRDSQRIAIWGLESFVQVYDADTGKVRYILQHGTRCHGVHFSLDGRHVATASFDKTVRVWDYATGLPMTAPIPHPDWVFDALFSPDGRYLLTTCRDGMARVWDWQKGRLVSPPFEHHDEVHPADFTPDGNWVVTASLDQTARVWDWRTGMPVTPPLPVSGKALSVAVTPDGNHAVIGGFVNALDVIDLRDLSAAAALTADDLCRWAELLSGQRVHEGGGVTNLTVAEWLERWQVQRLPK